MPVCTHANPSCVQNLHRVGYRKPFMSETQDVRRGDPGSAQAVRDAVAHADRRRRTREASRQLWRIAPAVAAVALVVAAATRWLHGPVLVPVAVLAAGALALIAYGYAARRHHAISDEAAAEIDSDAGLRGELRSASWFAARDTRDAWADLHLQRAAARLDATDWGQLYPVRRAARS